MKYYILGVLIGTVTWVSVTLAESLIQDIDIQYMQIQENIRQRTGRISHPLLQHKQAERLWKRAQSHALYKARTSVQKDQQLLSIVLRNKILERNNTYLIESTQNLIAQWELIHAINNMRLTYHLPILNYDTRLAKLAYDHALDLSTQFPRDVDQDGVMEILSHTGSDGAILGIRAQRRGYYSFVAENLAYNQLTAYQVLMDWSKSPSHYANILCADCNGIGVAKIGQYRVMVVGDSR